MILILKHLVLNDLPFSRGHRIILVTFGWKIFGQKWSCPMLDDIRVRQYWHRVSNPCEYCFNCSWNWASTLELRQDKVTYPQSILFCPRCPSWYRLRKQKCGMSSAFIIGLDSSERLYQSDWTNDKCLHAFISTNMIFLMLRFPNSSQIKSGSTLIAELRKTNASRSMPMMTCLTSIWRNAWKNGACKFS
jgi:hypothetical protein